MQTFYELLIIIIKHVNLSLLLKFVIFKILKVNLCVIFLVV